MGPVVVLVDHKIRDLEGATLLAHHLRGFGLECQLEPLEAFRAVLAAHKPSFILFNHLYGSQLVRWAKRLGEIGVQVGVLLNEGLIYDEDELRYIAGRHYKDTHADHFFCWNGAHKKAIEDEGAYKSAELHIVGIPRFDFYVPPWSSLNVDMLGPRTARPRVLVCTNFSTAKFWELPKAVADQFFAPWIDRIPIYRNYWRSVEAHWKARERILDYLNALIASEKYDIILRPHPRESEQFYEQWLSSLPPRARSFVRIERTAMISSLITTSDIEISCETCTTAVESWIARRPTVELIFERDPAWFHEVIARANITCDNPEAIVATVDRALNMPLSPEMAKAREAHLTKWCSSVDGKATYRVAKIISESVKTARSPDFSKLSIDDYRRAVKLHAYKKFGQAYHFDAMLPLKRMLLRKRYLLKQAVYDKSIKPKDVAAARRKIERPLHG